MLPKTSRFITLPIRKFSLSESMPIGLVLLLALFLRLYQLGKESLWFDEFNSLSAVKTISEEGLFVNRILYFLFLKFWVLVGESETWLRLPSVIFGVASVYLVYLLGVKLFDKKIGLIAAVLLTLSPLAVFHSQEVRMYMLSVFIGLSGTLAITYYTLYKKVKYIIAWFVLRILAILTTPINILLLIPDSIILGFYIFRKSKLKRQPRFWIGLTVITLALGLLFFLVLAPSIDNLILFIQKRQVQGLELTFITFVGGISRFTVWPLKSPFQGLSWVYAPFFKLYGIGIISLIIAFLFARQSTLHKYWIALWGLLPLVVLFFVCKFISPSLWGIPRYLLFAAPYIFIILALGIVQIWRWRKGVGLVLASVYFFAVTGSLWNYYVANTNDDWRGIFEAIHSYEQPNDALVVFPLPAKLATDYYYKGNGPIYVFDTIEDFPNDDAKITLIMDDILMSKELENITNKESRFWFLFNYSSTGMDEKRQEIVRQRINQELGVISQYYFPGTEVFLVDSDNSLK